MPLLGGSWTVLPIVLAAVADLLARFSGASLAAALGGRDLNPGDGSGLCHRLGDGRSGLPNDANQELLEQIASRVGRKIEWPQELPPGNERVFLFAFYEAHRQRLEHKMLLGKRQEHKLF